MVDISKYKDVISLIESYNGVIDSNRADYRRELDRHPADFVKISNESNREDDMALYSRLSALRELFPNVEFSKSDIELLSGYYSRKQDNFSIINRTKLNIRSQELYGGRTVSKEERKRMYDAEEKQPNLEEQYTEAYTGFFDVCEKLSNPEILDNPEYDFEGEIFSTIYEQGFRLRPQNPILRKYYETYKARRDKEKENESLSEEKSTLSEQVEQANAENTQLKEDNDKLKSENTELKQKNSRLQSMLAKTLKFCDYVRESRFGRFFFRKKIKELPPSQSMEEER